MGPRFRIQRFKPAVTTGRRSVNPFHGLTHHTPTGGTGCWVQHGPGSRLRHELHLASPVFFSKPPASSSHLGTTTNTETVRATKP
ncbi:hypothetical protein E2562_005439 [Oryza meyeriana var. granulata]|uniref:Uncharacterized protein n=1 Tax=Oryza meyeriana var. granulata TaxID=110450 RepID=A0A6G1DFS3_9ORYZ|nr:hypothetical protein E2562_005439 [Oryza meyeriana var. granulata]